MGWMFKLRLPAIAAAAAMAGGWSASAAAEQGQSARPAPPESARPAPEEEATRLHEQGVAALDGGDPAAAAPLFARALAIRERAGGLAEASAFSTAAYLAAALRGQQKFAEAEALYWRMAEAATAAGGADDLRTLQARAALGGLYYERDRAGEAAPLLADVLPRLQRVAGMDAFDTLSATNYLAFSYLSLGRAREAEALLRTMVARTSAALGADHNLTLNAISGLGAAYAELDRFADAEPLLASAVETALRSTGADSSWTINALTSLAELYTDHGRYSQAEPLLARALAAAERMDPANPVRLSTVQLMAALYFHQDRFAEAEALLRPLIATTEQAFGAANIDTLNRRNALARLYVDNRPAEAEAMLRPLLTQAEQALGARDPVTSQIRSNFGGALMNLGRFAEAEAPLVGVLEAQEQADGSPEAITRALTNLGLLYDRQLRFPDAEALYLRAIGLADSSLGADHPSVQTVRNNLGLLYTRTGRFQEAEGVLAALVQASTRTFGPDHRSTLIAQVNLAGAYVDLGSLDRAEPAFRAVADRSARLLGQDHPLALRSAYHLGTTVAGRQRLGEADPILAGALERSLRTTGQSHPYTLDAARELTTVRLRQPAAAGTALAPARLLLQGIRSRRSAQSSDRRGEAQSLRDQQAQSAWLTLFADAAWSNAGPQGRHPLQPEAFGALQDAMAGAANRAIVQMAAGRYADRAGAGLGAAVRERQALETEWNAAQDQLSVSFGDDGDSPTQARATLRTEITRIEARLDAIDARLRSEFPDYFALIRPSPVDLSAARALLGADEAILLVVPGDFGTHVMALSRDAAQWVRSDWTSDRVTAAVQRLRWDAGARVDGAAEQIRQWQEADSRRGRPTFDRQAAYALFQQLVAPVSSVLANKTSLYVAAGGVLSGLPFSLLVTEPPQGRDDDPQALRSTAWLADRHALIHIPSIQSLALLRGTARAPQGARSDAFLAFGDPVLDGVAEQRRRRSGSLPPDAARVLQRSRTRSGGVIADLSALRRLARLPGTAVEIESVRRALDAPTASAHLAARATERAVRNADLRNTQLLLFSTHGLTADEAGEMAEPGLVLTPPREATEQDDGYLSASEVSALRLDADWVILSACNTATGEGAEGQGLSGLARAFFYAGARNLLASHWPVSDEVAPVMITRTLALERAGTARAQALQQAMREIRLDASHDTAAETWAHPFYWAPFVLIGDGGR